MNWPWSIAEPRILMHGPTGPGLCYCTDSRRPESRDKFKMAIDLTWEEWNQFPGDPEIIGNLIEYHAMIGDEETTRRLIATGDSLASDNGELLYQIGDAYELIGDRTAALRYLAIAIRHGIPVERIQATHELADLVADPRFVRIISAESGSEHAQAEVFNDLSQGGRNEEEKMKSIRIPVLLLLLAGVLLLMGGCYRHYVDVYINEMCEPVTLENDEMIDPLIVFPGDYVVFTNMREVKSVTLEFPVGMFEVDEVTINAGHRAILKVVDKGETEGYIKRIDCPIGDPKVKVGEGP